MTTKWMKKPATDQIARVAQVSSQMGSEVLRILQLARSPSSSFGVGVDPT
jgi:hypothetical protein